MKIDTVIKRLGNAALVACLGFPATATPQTDADPMRDWLIERVEKHGTLQGQTTVAIENLHGDLRVRTSNDDNLTVFAVIQRHAADAQKPEIVLSQDATVFNVGVRYPQSAADGSSSAPPGHDKRRVDIAVLVPKPVQLDIETDHGRAESKGHAGPIRITTRDGRIIVVTKGSLDAKSEHGPVHVTFQNRVWTQPSSIETRTGEIEVQLMEHPDVRVEIATAGEVATDYSLEITSYPGTSRKQAVARIGEALHELALNSQAGRVAIRRIFDWIHADPKAVPAQPEEPLAHAQ